MIPLAYAHGLEPKAPEEPRTLEAAANL